MKPQYLIVTDLGLPFELLQQFLVFDYSPLHLVYNLIQLLATLVGSPHLLGPLLLLREQTLLDLHAHRCRVDILEAIAFEATLLHGGRQFHALRLLQEIGFLKVVELAQPLNNLVLTWEVNLFQVLLHLGFDLHKLLFKTSNSLVLRFGQEFQILALVLQLPERIFPLELALVLVLLVLDYLHVKFVVLFR